MVTDRHTHTHGKATITLYLYARVSECTKSAKQNLLLTRILHVYIHSVDVQTVMQAMNIKVIHS